MSNPLYSKITLVEAPQVRVVDPLQTSQLVKSQVVFPCLEGKVMRPVHLTQKQLIIIQSKEDQPTIEPTWIW